MEYEIEDEDLLFDPSTNPSLMLAERRARDRADRRRLQRAEDIPEEEEQLA